MSNLSRREKEKLTRKEAIIDIAEKLFCKNGFEQTSMDTIARESEFTKRTVYQYFLSKEDLYFAVITRGCGSMFSYIQTAALKGKTGYEKIYFSCLAYYRFYNENPAMFKLMNFVGYVKKLKTPNMIIWSGLDDRLFKGIENLIQSGIKDGSLKKNLDPVKTAYSIAFITTGFFRQLSETGKTFTGHFKLNFQEFVDFSLELFLKSIKA